MIKGMEILEMNNINAYTPSQFHIPLLCFTVAFIFLAIASHYNTGRVSFLHSKKWFSAKKEQRKYRITLIIGFIFLFAFFLQIILMKPRIVNHSYKVKLSKDLTIGNAEEILSKYNVIEYKDGVYTLEDKKRKGDK